MLVCNSCGAVVQESSFCSECGASLVHATRNVAGENHLDRLSKSDASPNPVHIENSSALYSGEVPSQVGSISLSHLDSAPVPDSSNQIVFAVSLLIAEIICCCCGGGIAAIFSGIALYFARQVENTIDREEAQNLLDKAKIFNIISLVVFVFCLLAAVTAMFVGILLK